VNYRVNCTFKDEIVLNQFREICRDQSPEEIEQRKRITERGFWSLGVPHAVTDPVDSEPEIGVHPPSAAMKICGSLHRQPAPHKRSPHFLNTTLRFSAPRAKSLQTTSTFKLSIGGFSKVPEMTTPGRAGAGRRRVVEVERKFQFSGAIRRIRTD